MTGVAIFLLVIVFFWLGWPYIARWMRRKAMEKTQEYILRSMGFAPPPKGGKNRGRKREQDRPQRPRQEKRSGPIIPKEYAEDVEFVEIKEFSDTKIETRSANSREIYHESQVSDVEWVEIKSTGTK